MKNEIKNYLLNNMGVTRDVVNEINIWDYSLNFLEIVCMEDLDTYLEGYAPHEIIDRIFYGNFNPNDAYFRSDAYANLESLNEWELIEEYEIYIDEIIDALLKNIENVEIYDDELKEMLIKYKFDIDKEK